MKVRTGSSMTEIRLANANPRINRREKPEEMRPRPVNQNGEKFCFSVFLITTTPTYIQTSEANMTKSITDAFISRAKTACFVAPRSVTTAAARKGNSANNPVANEQRPITRIQRVLIDTDR